MPHITVKLFEGRDKDTKMKLAKALQAELGRVLACGTEHVTVAVEDQNLEEWGNVYDHDIQGNPNLLLPPSYDWDAEYLSMNGKKRGCC